jgi:ATP-dependent Clp protease ATP-binding subunit ClpA
MLSTELEHCLNDAFHRARKTGDGHLTLEHLLLALLDTPNVCDVLRACRGDPTRLKQDLEAHLAESTLPQPDKTDEPDSQPLLHVRPTVEVQPTLGLQRVLQRAVFHVTRRSVKEVGVLDVLVALFSEKQSHAVHLLNGQNITRLDVCNYIWHGLKPPG